MEIEIKPRSKIAPRSTGVVWGPTKAGKTTLLSTLPKPIVFFVLDPEGANVIPPHGDIYVVDLSTMTAKEQVDACRGKIPTMIKEELPSTTASVVLDSLTILSWSSLKLAVLNKVGMGKGFVPTLEAPGLSAYGARTNYITDSCWNILRATAKHSMHCWFTAHQDEPTMDSAGTPLYTTLTLSGKSINQLGVQVSEIWHLREHDGKRFISIRNSRGRQPMGSRMFRSDKSEFELKFTPGKDQPMEDWIKEWQQNDLVSIPTPR